MDLEYLLGSFVSQMTIVWTISILIVTLSILLYFSIPSSDPTTDVFINLLNSLPVRLLRPLPNSFGDISIQLKENEDLGDKGLFSQGNIRKENPRITLTPSSQESMYSNKMVDLDKMANVPPCRVLRRVLLVIAHPDDEVMFFSPALLQLGYWTELAKENESSLHFIYSLSDTSLDLHKSSSAGSLLLSRRNLPLIEVHVLCLSVGSSGGDGLVRRQELYASCESFGIQRKNISIIDHPKLQDGSDQHWNHSIIQSLLSKHYNSAPFDIIFTFDELGVSCHPNHMAIYHGVRLFLAADASSSVRAFSLHSPNLFLKFSSWISVLFFPVFSLVYDISFINNIYQVYLVAIPRMLAHHSSQMFWFRYFYLFFSSLMITNYYKEINKLNNP